MTEVVVSPGRKAKAVKQTFVLYEEEVRVISSLKAFSRMMSVLTTHLPAVENGDSVIVHAPTQKLVGEAMVLDHKHVTLGSGEQRSALAIQLMREDNLGTDFGTDLGTKTQTKEVENG